MDLSKLSDDDLMALKAGDLSRVSDAGLAALKGEPAKAAPSFGEMFKNEVLGVGGNVRDLLSGGVRGAGSIGATLLRPFESAQENAERRTKMDQALTSLVGADPSSIAYGAGKIGAEIAGTAGIGGAIAKPVGAVLGRVAPSAAPAVVQALRTGGMSTGGTLPRAADLALRTGAGAAVGGASAGLIDPEQAGTGAAIGGALPGAAMVAGATGRALGRALRPSAETQAVAQKAQQYGIPVTLGDVAENRLVQGARSILGDAPLTGGMARGAQEAKQEAFNRAVGGTFGAPAPKLTPQVIDQAKAKMGAEFDRIWNSNALQVDPQMVNSMAAMRQQASKLPQNEGASLIAEIDDLFSRMKPNAAGALEIDGQTANKFQQYLRRRAEGSAGLRNELNDLRQTIIGAFNRGISPADEAALTLNRTQYKAFKTVEPLLKSAELGIAGRPAGDVPAALLPGAVSKSYSNLQGAPLADLAQVGSRMLVDRTPQTGGSARAALQNTGIGAALTGIGLGAGLPAAGAAAGLGVGAQRLLNSQRAAQMLMQPAGQNQALIEALRRSLAVSAPVISVQ